MILFATYYILKTNRHLQGANSAIAVSTGFLIIWIC